MATNSTVKAIAASINALTGTTGITATAETKAIMSNLDADGTVTFTLYGKDTSSGSAISAAVTTTDLTNLVSAINAKTTSTGITAELSADKTSFTMTNADGYDIRVNDFSGVVTGSTIKFGGANADGDATAAVTLTAGDPASATDSSIVGGSIRLDSSNSSFTVSQTSTDVFGANAGGSSVVDISTVDIGTQSGANDAVSIIDGALAMIDTIRGDLGAIQNRFESTISNLQSVAENLTAARSRILDADIAMETADMTKANILQQAGVAILAQANQTPQLALALLK